MEYKLTLPYPPSTNRLYVRSRWGVALSDEAKAFKEIVAAELYNLQLEPLTGLLKVTIDAYRKADRGDLDNVLKITLDALNKRAWEDDKQIVEILARRWQDANNPRLEIRVEQVERMK